MGWRNVGPLPVRVCPPLGRGGEVTHVAVDAAGLGAPEVQRVLTELDDHPRARFTNRHTPAYLRLAPLPPARAYVLHVGSDLVAISTADQRFGVRAAVILKLLPRGGRSGPISSRQMIAAVCRHHRAPYAVYAGWNAHVTVRGLQPPRRLQPSPLYLILRTLTRASRSRRSRPRHVRVPRHGRVLSTVPPITFTLDLEDNRAPHDNVLRYLDATRRLLDFLDDARDPRDRFRRGRARRTSTGPRQGGASRVVTSSASTGGSTRRSTRSNRPCCATTSGAARPGSRTSPATRSPASARRCSRSSPSRAGSPTS